MYQKALVARAASVVCQRVRVSVLVPARLRHWQRQWLPLVPVQIRACSLSLRLTRMLQVLPAAQALVPLAPGRAAQPGLVLVLPVLPSPSDPSLSLRLTHLPVAVV